MGCQCARVRRGAPGEQQRELKIYVLLIATGEIFSIGVTDERFYLEKQIGDALKYGMYDTEYIEFFGMAIASMALV